jgi:hypothetical protein
MRKVGQNPATSGEILPELKDIQQMALEFTGIFDEKLQELDFNLSSLNTL